MTGGGIPQYFGMKKRTIGLICVSLAWTVESSGQEQVLDAGWKHLRNTGAREWSDFPGNPVLSEYILGFPGALRNLYCRL